MTTNDLDHLAEWLSWLIPAAQLDGHGVEALDRLVRAVPTSALGRIDKNARRPPGPPADGARLDADEIVRLLAAHGDSLAVCVAASLHRRGFVREAAVRRLADQWTGEELRWLLLRVADPVPQVRTIAEAAVHARALTPGPSDRYRSRVIDAVSLLTSKVFNRPWSTKLRADLVELLLQPPPEHDDDDPLGAASWSRDLPTRRSAVELLVRRDNLLAVLLTQARRDDVVAVATVTTAAFSDASICEQAARSLFADDNARLRAIGLQHLVEHGHSAHDAVAALCDPAPNVRRVTRTDTDDAPTRTKNSPGFAVRTAN